VNLAAEAPLWLALIFAILVIAAGLQDALQGRMSNRIVLLLIVGAVAGAIVLGPKLELWQNVAVFAALLVLGTAMFAKGVLGGGDVKVLAATSLWFSIAGAAKMLLAVAMSGAVLALLVIVARLVKWGEGVQRRLPFLRPRAGVPYGIAIAAGAVVAAALQR
jgi:prepilin peptidase CpaA